MAAQENFPLINVVCRAAQVDLLKSLGAQYVLNSADDDFAEHLKDTCVRLGATAAFEAVAGDLTGIVLNAMPPKSTVYVYGALSEEACGNIDPIEIIFQEKAITGFYLSTWLRECWSLSILRAADRVQRMFIDGRIEAAVQRKVGLADVSDGLKQYVEHMTEGKVLIVPHLQ